MTRGVNLLPWREERRQRQRRSALTASVLVAVLTLGALGGVWWKQNSDLNYQNSRNQFLQQAIARVEKQLREIRDIQKRKDELMARMAVIRELEEERTKLVLGMTELANSSPEGVFFSSLKRSAAGVELKGVAQSSLAALQRNRELQRVYSDMSWQDDLKRIDINQPAAWPGWFVIVMALLGCLLFAYGSWHFVLSDQRLTLESSRKKEAELKKTFSAKKGMVVNLPAYKAQMVEIEELLAAMLQKLPDSTEVPSLLVDITEAGSRRGLEFSVFDPQAQKLEAFYTSLPIRVEVRGSYHQIANFVSDLAGMSRIVTVGDLTLVGEEDGEVKASLMLQTYSYLPEGV
ncbi:MAG: hypothetical protein EBU28_05130 [Gammaproteobacteria bacterium]|nr:hypothetical protein [Gammaproteobacteria bacterium]